MKINVSQMNLMRNDVSQILKNWCQWNHFILSKLIQFPIKSSSRNVQLSLKVYKTIVDLKPTKEGIEILVTDKHEFQGRNWEHFWEISDFKNPDASLKVEDLYNESPTTSIKGSLERSMEKIRPVVTQKVEFEDGVINIHRNFCKPRIIGILMRSKVRSEVISADSSATRYEVFDWDFNRRNQTCRYREKLVWMSTWILIEEIVHLFLEKWSDWKSSFSKTNGNFSASPVYQGADKRDKCKDFSMEYPLERKGFRYGPGWKKMKRVFYG